MQKNIYHKLPKFSDARKLCCNLPKIQTKTKFLQISKISFISDTYCILMIAIPLLLPHEKETN